MRTHAEYVKLAVVALTADHGTEQQIDAENAFYDMMRADGLWSPKMDDLKSSVVDRVSTGLILRVEYDFKNRKPTFAEERF